MILSVDSDTAYLVAPGAKSRIPGFFYFKHAPDGTILQKLTIISTLNADTFGM